MKYVVLMTLFFFLMPLFATESQKMTPAQAESALLISLYRDGMRLYADAAKVCQNLPQRNQTLLDAITKLKESAVKKKKREYAKALVNATYLLDVLQKEITKVCGRVRLVDRQTLKIIIANDAPALIEARKVSKNQDEFVSAISDTEYSKFLFDMIAVTSFNRMSNEWGATMARKHSTPQEIIKNIHVANKALHDTLQKFVKMLLYYEKQ